MGTGLQNIPFRIPEKWSATWYQQHLRDVLALADSRNSIGVGLTVEGEPNTLATYAVDSDIINLIDQPFVLTASSAYLPNERVITAGDGINFIDSGPGGTLTIELADHGIPYNKLEELTTFGVLGQSPHIPGGPEEIAASQDGDLLCVQSDALGFTNAPVWTGIHNWLDGISATWGTGGDLSVVHDGAAAAITNTTGALTVTSTIGAAFVVPTIPDFTINGESIVEIAQDAVGTIFVDSASIDFTYDDGANTITADVDESWSATWTANHRWIDNAEVQLGTGGDLRLYHDGTNSLIENDTGLMLFYLNSTTKDALFSADTDWNLTGVTEVPNLIAERKLAVLRAGSTSAPTFRGYSYGSAGTRAAPAAAAIDDGLFALEGAAYDGSAWGARIYARAFAAETWSTSAHGNFWQIGTCALGVVAARTILGLWSAGDVRMTLDNAELSIGAGGSTANNTAGDLRLSHDGTNSLIRNDTGELRLQFSTTVSAAIETSGAFDMRQQIQHSNVISPTQLTANTDNWNPTGLATASVIRINIDAARNITGIVAQPAGTLILLVNTTAFTATLTHDATSTAANRFLCPNVVNFALLQGAQCWIWYDGTSSRWRVVGGN